MNAVLIDRLEGGCHAWEDETFPLQLPADAVHRPGESAQRPVCVVLGQLVYERSRETAVWLLCGCAYHPRLHRSLMVQAIQELGQTCSCPQRLAGIRRLS